MHLDTLALVTRILLVTIAVTRGAFVPTLVHVSALPQS